MIRTTDEALLAYARLLGLDRELSDVVSDAIENAKYPCGARFFTAARRGVVRMTRPDVGKVELHLTDGVITDIRGGHHG